MVKPQRNSQLKMELLHIQNVISNLQIKTARLLTN